MIGVNQEAHNALVQETVRRLQEHIFRLSQKAAIIQGYEHDAATLASRLHEVNLEYMAFFNIELITGTADQIANEILGLKWHFENTLQEFINIFSEWLQDLSCLKRLFTLKLQRSYRAYENQVTFTIEDIGASTQTGYAALTLMSSRLSEIEAALLTAKTDATAISFTASLTTLAEWNSHAYMDWKVKLEETEKVLIAEHSLIVCERFSQVLTKVERIADISKLRNKDAYTRTDLSVKFLRFAPFDPDEAVKIELQLVNESTAQDILSHKNVHILRAQNYSPPKICAIDISRNEVRGMPIESFMTTSEINANILEATFTKISVIDPVRERTRGGNNRDVFRQKLNFIIIADLPYTFSNGREIVLTAWTLSEPLVVCSHSDHRLGAYATVLWNNYFFDPSLQYFGVSGSARFSFIMDMLSTYFTEATRSADTPGLSLLNIHKECLEDMLVEHMYTHQKCSMDYVRNDGTVSRDDLIVDLEFLFFEKIRDKDFSYWSWFFKAANILKKEYFRNLWENGYFMGFVGKERCLTLLEGQQVGDFLVRFSQSEEAAFAIAFYTPDRSRNNRVYFYPAKVHWNASDTQVKREFLMHLHSPRGMVDRFLRVYPGIPKIVAFPTNGIILMNDPVQVDLQNNRFPYIRDENLLM